jgi:hypothetical protein
MPIGPHNLNFITIHLGRERPLEEKSEQEKRHMWTLNLPPLSQFSFWVSMPMFQNSKLVTKTPFVDTYLYKYIKWEVLFYSLLLDSRKGS